jgi:hypothetical protein
MKYFYPFIIPNYDKMQACLASKYANEFESGKMGTKILPWSIINFLELYVFLEQKIRPLGASVFRSRLFYTPPGGHLDTHIDGKELTNDWWALNLPIDVPADNHWHEWYSYNGELKREWSPVYTDLISPANPELLFVADKLLLDKPHFVNVGQFHSVTNNSDRHRLVLTIRFNTNNIHHLMAQLTSV